MRRASIIAAIAVAVSALTEPASAQSTAPAAPPPASRPAAGQTLSPPRLVHEEPARYPEGEKSEATVIVEILVDLDGSVSEARVADGEEPFASAAVDAAKKCRFEPARRGDRAVRARIKIAITFTPPPPPRKRLDENGAPEGSAAPSAHAQMRQQESVSAVDEVVVIGRREPRTPTEHRMGRAEMRVIPGAFGDPFRAIDILPGLVPIVSGLPYFYIRGAPPSAVGYYIDEVRVPYLFHFALGPGVIQPALVEEVALHPAAFPARYGRYAGGIVAGTTREPATEMHGEGQIRLYDSGAYVEAPLLDGRASAGVGGRFSYTAAILSLLAPEITIDYRDYNARFSYALSDRWRLSTLALGAYDYASDEDSDGRERVFFASEFHRLDVRLDRRGANGAETRIATTVGIDRTRLEDARFAQDIVTGVRARHREPLSKSSDVEVGADFLADNYSGDVPSRYAVRKEDYDQAVALFSPRTETATGAWVSGSHRPAKGWDLTATARADVFTSEGRVLVGPSPRVSMRVPLHAKLAFLAAMGIAPQPPAFAIPIPAVGYHGLPGGLAYGYQKSAGLELLLPLEFTFKAVGFHHSYFNLRDFAQDRGNVDFDEPQIEPSSPTQAFGLELFLMRKLTKRYSAFASATISRAQLGSTQTAAARLSPFDRTYVAQVGGVVDLGRHWRFSSRVLTYRGWPGATPADEHLPAFWRVDARLEKRWFFGEKRDRWVAFVMEGLNVTGSKEIVGRSCAGGRCRNEEFGPLIAPSLGVEGGL